MDILNKINNFIETEIEETGGLLESLIDFVGLIDLDNLNEDQINKIDEIMDMMEDDEFLNEKMERVVRDGKVVKRKVCQSGYKAQDGKCVKISSQEKRARAKGAKRGAKKKKAHTAQISRKRAKSMKKVR